MEKKILIGGPAGQGINVTSHFLAKVFTDYGYYVFNYRDYESLISGGHNFNVLAVSDVPVFSHSDSYDIILAIDQRTIDLHEKNLKKGGFILGSNELKTKAKSHKLDVKKVLQGLDLKKFFKESRVPKTLENDIYLGWILNYFGIEKKFLSEEIKKVFSKNTEVIKQIIEKGYQEGEPKEKLKKAKNPKFLISGSEAIGLGAILSGLDFYIAYPMTPATPVMIFLTKKQLECDLPVLQLENEIAVVNAALGANFTGAKAMIGTSGGGFALMAEALSLQGMSEVPLVVYLSQRPGPGTGVPTQTLQGDLRFALNAGHGEFPRVVVAPGDPEEALFRTQELFYLSYKYNVLSILLSDKHLSESEFSFDDLQKSDVSNGRFIIKNPKANYLPYKFTKSGVSPRAVPGQNVIVKFSSYEHREDGVTTENSAEIKKMAEKRLRKNIELKKEIKKLKPISVYGKGRNLIVGWGSTKGAILDAMKELKNFKFLQISYLKPFPHEEVLKELKKAGRVILVENNATGQLGDLIRENTGFEIKERILKYDGHPFVREEIINKLKNNQRFR